MDASADNKNALLYAYAHHFEPIILFHFICAYRFCSPSSSFFQCVCVLWFFAFLCKSLLSESLNKTESLFLLSKQSQVDSCRVLDGIEYDFSFLRLTLKVYGHINFCQDFICFVVFLEIHSVGLVILTLNSYNSKWIAQLGPLISGRPGE